MLVSSHGASLLTERDMQAGAMQQQQQHDNTVAPDMMMNDDDASLDALLEMAPPSGVQTWTDARTRFAALATHQSAFCEAALTMLVDGAVSKVAGWRLLCIPHIMAQCTRALYQVVALYHSIDDASALPLRVGMTERALQAWADHVGEILGQSTLALHDAAHLFASLVFGWMFPLAAADHDTFLCTALCEFGHYMNWAAGRAPDDLIMPLCRAPGVSALELVERADRWLLAVLGQPALDLRHRAHLLDTARVAIEEPIVTSLTLVDGVSGRVHVAARLPLLLPRHVALRAHGRAEPQHTLFFGSPSRAPLPWPPPRTRQRLPAEMLGSALTQRLVRKRRSEAGELTYTQRGQQAVRALSDGKPEELPRRLLPLCALSALHSLVEEGEPWHNEDRRLVTNLFMDAGAYDIEDMGNFFQRTLSIDPNGASKRIRHATSHIRRYAGEIAKHEAHGGLAILTSRCEWLAADTVNRQRQMFHCPLSVTHGAPEVERIKTLIQWQGLCTSDQERDIVALASRGDREHACLAHYNATRVPNSYVKHKPHVNPMFYIHNKAIAESHH